MKSVRRVAEAAETPSRTDILELLTAEGALQQGLFEQARQVRRNAGQDDVVLRAVIELSNACCKNCDYCAMRTSNRELARYSLTAGDIIQVAERIRETGIKVVFLQGGQNPGNDTVLEEVIPVIRKDIGLEVLLCLGERPKETYERLFRMGVGSYILKYETSDPLLHRRLTHGELASRLRCIEWIRESGMKLGTGNIVGLPGQTLESLVDDILLGVRIAPDFVSSSPFIPSSSTPLGTSPKGSANLTLNTMAIMRIILKRPLIPSVSALESVCPEGQTAGLNAGANVVTINFTPKSTQELYRIYSEQRFVVSLEHALRSIELAGLRVRGQLRMPGSQAF
jgi:biotin synthase